MAPRRAADLEVRGGLSSIERHKLPTALAGAAGPLVSAASPRRARAATAASGVVETFHLGLPAIMRDGATARFDERSCRLGSAIGRAFSAGTMARLASGGHRRAMSAAQRPPVARRARARTCVVNVTCGEFGRLRAGSTAVLDRNKAAGLLGPSNEHMRRLAG